MTKGSGERNLICEGKGELCRIKTSMVPRNIITKRPPNIRPQPITTSKPRIITTTETTRKGKNTHHPRRNTVSTLTSTQKLLISIPTNS